jgi:hypothetical protein
MLSVKHMHSVKHCQEILAFTTTPGLMFTVIRWKRKRKRIPTRFIWASWEVEPGNES